MCDCSISYTDIVSSLDLADDIGDIIEVFTKAEVANFRFFANF